MDSKSLTKTGFCDKQVDNVTNNELKKHTINYIIGSNNLRNVLSPVEQLY